MTEPPETMRGVWLTGHGDFDKLEMRREIPVPRPSSREVLIRVAAAGATGGPLVEPDFRTLYR